MARIPQQAKRPSRKEVRKKVRDALDALNANRCSNALTKHVSMCMGFLGVGEASEMWDGIHDLLVELWELDPASHYVGGSPPQKSYEPGYLNDELWAYCWPSQLTGCETYLKFVIKKEWFFLFSCHERSEQNK